MGGIMNLPKFLETSQKAFIILALISAMLFVPSVHADDQSILEEEKTISELVCTYKASDLVKVYGAKAGDFLRRTIHKFNWSKPKELAFSGYGPHSDTSPIYRFSEIIPENEPLSNSKGSNASNASRYANALDTLKRFGSKAKDLGSKARVLRSTAFVVVLPKAIKGATVIKIGATSVVVIVISAAGQEMYCYFTEDGDEETPE